MPPSLVSRRLAALIGGLAIATVAGASVTQAAPADQTVTIDAFAFAPAETSVPVGTSVVWTNLQNGVQHTTSSLDGLWDSGALSTSDAFRFTFTQVGDFAYQCTIHPSMRGIVHVVADAGAGAPSGADGAGEQPAATPPTVTLSTAPTQPATLSTAPLAPATQVATATPLSATPTPVAPTARPTSTPATSYRY